MVQAGKKAGKKADGPTGQQPQPAEPAQDVVEEAVMRHMAHMFGISPDATTSNLTLGPTPISEILLDGTPTAALIDTGSPVSIVSLDFFLTAAKADREEGQTPVEFRECVHPTTTSLRCYRGTLLMIVGQAVCRLTTRDVNIDTLLQIQEKAPVDLLLGTDTLHRLGFSLTCVGKEDLLAEQAKEDENKSDRPHPADVTRDHTSGHKNSSPVERATIKLIRATRLPAGHVKVIQRKSQCLGRRSGDCLFEPALKRLHTNGLSMADAAVEVGDGGQVTLVIANPGREPVQLEEGEVLGELQPATLLECAARKQTGATTTTRKT